MTADPTETVCRSCSARSLEYSTVPMASVPATSPANPAKNSTREPTPAPANPSQIPADVRMPSLASGMCGRIHPKTPIAAFCRQRGEGALPGTDPDVDVIYVATPHPMHHDNAILALRAGKHVLIEKPFTMTAAEAREIVGVARQRGLFAMEAMWTRFLPDMAIIRDWLARGVLGDVVTLTADHGQWFAEDAGFRLFAPELGGGALLDLGVYPVSFASMVLGTPSRIVSMSDPAFTGVDAQTSMLFGYDTGAQAVLTCTLRAKSPTRAAIVGTDARIEVEGDFYAPVTLIPRKGDPTRVESRHEGRGLRHQADEVARRLAAHEAESPLMPLDESISIMETMDIVLAQARQDA